MASKLENLIKGDCEAAHDEEDCELQIPDDLDLDKFNRGRNFFKRNIGQCLLAMMMSLILGLSIDRFLKVLVCTGMSATPEKSFKRYMSTIFHVLKWHYGNVWDSSSSASKSIRTVRKLHAQARKFMRDKGNNDNEVKGARYPINSELEMNHVYLSQYEMGLVQSGFMGVIVMYPEQFGIHCSSEELDDYVYYWRWIGYLLGISDNYNICIDGYEEAYIICHAIEHEIVISSIENPPAKFYPMADAFVNGFKFYPFSSTKSLIAVAFRKARLKCPFPLSLIDRLRMYTISGFLSALFYFPLFTYFFNRTVERVFQCHTFS